MRFFTSDWHLGSENILRYANRPFSNAAAAAAALIANAGSTCKASDSLIHVGDFYLKGSDRHDSIEDVNKLQTSYEALLQQMKPRLVLIEGNHDGGHSCEADAKSMTVDLNQSYRNVYVSHFPSTHKLYRGPRRCSVDHNVKPCISLCGHVHDSWLFCYDSKRNVLNVNVGIDVWDYKPASDGQICQLLDQYFSMRVCKKSVLTLAEWQQLQAANQQLIARQRMERKAEKYAAKGLTEEECERRRTAAMKAKGLIRS